MALMLYDASDSRQQEGWYESLPPWVLERQTSLLIGWSPAAPLWYESHQGLPGFQAFQKWSLHTATSTSSALVSRLLQRHLYGQDSFSGLLQMSSMDYWCARTMYVSYTDCDGQHACWQESGYHLDCFLPSGVSDVEVTFSAVGGDYVYKVDQNHDGFPYIYDELGMNIQEKFKYDKCPPAVQYEICGSSLFPFISRISEIKGYNNDERPPECNGLVYRFLVDERTDAEGWIYGASPDEVDEVRAAGRAAPRFGDSYRHRWWKLTQPLSQTSAVVPACEDFAPVNSVVDVITNVAGNAAKSIFLMDPVALLRRSWKVTEEYESLCRRLPIWKDVDTAGIMCLASVYTRAAYGYTARAGMLDSVSAGALVFTVRKAVFDYAEDVDDHSHTRAFLDMMGMSPEDIVRVQWKVQGSLCPAYVMARDHIMRWIVVAVRGTVTWKDVITDAAARSVPFLGGFAHEGFLVTAQHLLNDLEEALCTEVKDHPGYQLVFCGHSMGGAVAALTVAILRTKFDWASGCIAIGIGTPGMLSNNLANKLADEKAVFTAVNGCDFAPRTSYSNVNRLIDEIAELGVMTSAMSAVVGELPPKDEDLEAVQLPPGVILQIIPASTSNPTISLLRSQPLDYHGTLLLWPDVEAHIPISYIEGLLHGFRAMLTQEKSANSAQDVAHSVLTALRRVTLNPKPDAFLELEQDSAFELVMSTFPESFLMTWSQ